MCREESESLFYLQEERMSCGLDRRVSCPYRQTRAPSCTDHPKYHDTSLVPTILNIMIRHWFWKNEKHLVIIRISLWCWLNEKHDLSGLCKIPDHTYSIILFVYVIYFACYVLKFWPGKYFCNSSRKGCMQAQTLPHSFFPFFHHRDQNSLLKKVYVF